MYTSPMDGVLFDGSGFGCPSFVALLAGMHCLICWGEKIKGNFLRELVHWNRLRKMVYFVAVLCATGVYKQMLCCTVA